MFKSLQARLILSYIVIIVVCLALVGLASLVLLRGYQRNLSYIRLTDRLNLTARLMGEALQRSATPQGALRPLVRQINRGDEIQHSILLLNVEGRVVAASNSKLNGRQFQELVLAPQPSSPEPRPPIRGEWQVAEGENWLYVGEQVYAQGEEGGQAFPFILVLTEPFQPVRHALGDLLPRLMWAGAIALAVSIVLAALLAYSIARPLERITRAAEEVAAGNYQQKLNISSPTEIASLAASFNSMACQVQTTLQSQQDLVANVSHELKTPLTSIQGFSQALMDGTASGPAAQARAATIILEESGRMRRLVDELLDLARLEAGQIVLAREPVDVATLLHDCVARLTPLAEQVGCALVVEVPESLTLVVGDVDRLGQVFDNLVDNALKYAQKSSSGGKVVLRGACEGAHVVCSVTDNGSGISAKDLARVFERFYQVDKSRVRREGMSSPGAKGGAGLGLAIARELVEAHGGQIRAESVEGLGTRFTVELPAHKPAGNGDENDGK